MIQIAYLLATALFFIGLKKLKNPLTARRGNMLAAIGMLIATVATLLDAQVLNYQMIGIAIVIGSFFGILAARLVKMTAMPQMVAIFNGFGGAASALIAISEYFRAFELGTFPAPLQLSIILVGTLIGGITFSGSIIAFGKLQEIIRGTQITFPGQQLFNMLLFFGIVTGSAMLVMGHLETTFFIPLALAPLLLGVLLVIPIGGADMPVVISLLNSLSGVAASAAGFVMENNILIIAGALVGASGLILTQIMCKAMNRSLFHVLFGSFGPRGQQPGKSGTVGGDVKPVRSLHPEDAALLLAYAESVIFVPGYGMAVAGAQHAVRELADELQKRGVTVKYAIHPVAGRMPGHMNVLLAEADVPYTQLYDLDDINPEFERTDVAVVIGANDVVNPAARDQQESPISGMPILNVDRAKQVIVIKRGLSPGFAGIDNELFYNEKTMMLFGSAKEMVTQTLAEVKQL